MFGSRVSQKPGFELISSFRKAFPHVVSAPTLATMHHGPGPDAAGMAPVAMDPEPAPSANSSTLNPNAFEADDSASKTMQDFRYAWSFMDPNSFDYSIPLVSQPAANYCPAPPMSSIDPMFSNQSAGTGTGLHSPHLGMGGGGMTTPTPVPLATHSLPTTHHDQINGTISSASSDCSSRRSSSALGFDHFNASGPGCFPGQFHDFSFGQQESYAPSSFVHSGADAAAAAGRSSPNDVDMQLDPPSYHHGNAPSTESESRVGVGTVNEAEKFRFNVTLRAPTAMIRHPKEIPVTYLNKGQTYTLSVVDSCPPPVSNRPVRYRTYVRISFDEEKQRSKVASCWQLWKEGRGLAEAQQRGGKLLAVECTDPAPGTAADDQSDRRARLESATFDGFCVSWTADPSSGVSYGAFSVRFNFLSTDFSHSKGVKGVPVRLCAKTEMMPPYDGADSGVEVSYCKVKLFRDHGAERKLSNDVAHVKKGIEKLKQQIAQIEMGPGNGKRKRGSITTSKVIKYSRSWSSSSDLPSVTNGEGRLPGDDDLQTKLVMMHGMFSSTRPVSVFSLRGDEQDDPDHYPVQLQLQPQPLELQDPTVKVRTLRHQSTQDSLNSTDAPPSLVAVSPTNSFVSLNSPVCHSSSHGRSDSGYHSSQNSFSEASSSENKRYLDYPVKIQNAHSNYGYIEAVDVDPTYQPPADCPPRPVACFFVRLVDRDEQQQQQQHHHDSEEDHYYRAIYLTERTVDDLKRRIAEKRHISPSQIARVLHVNRNGLKVVVDDDVVRVLPDGQDMVAEFSLLSPSSSSMMNTNDALEVILGY